MPQSPSSVHSRGRKRLFKRVTAATVSFCVAFTPFMQQMLAVRATAQLLAASTLSQWAARIAPQVLSRVGVGSITAATLVPPSAWADAYSDAINAGKSEGMSQLGGSLNATPKHAPSGDMSSMTYRDQSGATKTLSTGDLYNPGTTNPSQSTEVGSARGSFGNNSAFGTAVTGSSGRLELEGPSGTRTPQGNAYWAVKGAATMNAPPGISSTDPIFTSSDEAVTTGVAALLSGCSQTTTVTGSDTTSHVPDYQSCMRTISAPSTCHVQRTIDGPPATGCVLGSTVATVWVGAWPNGRYSGWWMDAICNDDPTKLKVHWRTQYDCGGTSGGPSGDFTLDTTTGTIVSGSVGGTESADCHWGTHMYGPNFYGATCTTGQCSLRFGWTGTSATTSNWLFPLQPWNRTITREVLNYSGNVDNQLVFNFSINGTGAATCTGTKGAMAGCGGTNWSLVSETGSGDLGGALGVNPFTAAEMAMYTGNGKTGIVDLTFAAKDGTVTDVTFTQTPTEANGWTGQVTFNAPAAGVQTTSIRVSATMKFIKQQFIDTPLGCRAAYNTQAGPPAASSGSTTDQLASAPGWDCSFGTYSVPAGATTLASATHGAELGGIFADAPIVPPAPVCMDATTKGAGSTVTLECFTDINGVEHCPSGTITPTDNQCTDLQSNPQCVFVSSSCFDSDPFTGACMTYEDKYDCGGSVTVMGNAQTMKTYACGGAAIRCMGNDCVDSHSENNSDFGKAAASIQVLDQASMDGGCKGADGSGCELFKGKKMDCKKAFWGLVDCCKDQAVPISYLDYMKLAYATYDLAQKNGILDSLASQGLDVQGAWKSVTGTASQTWDSITKPIVDGFDSVMSTGASGATDVVTGSVFSEWKQQAINQLNAWVTDTFGDQVAQQLFSSDAVTGALGFNLAADSILSTVSTALSWYTWIVTIIKIIWACRQNEFELNVNRQLKLCHELGTYCQTKMFGKFGPCVETRKAYCCYGSLFSRVLHEQAALQGVGAYGDPKSSSCNGFTMAQINAIDFNAVDLTEWIASLGAINRLPTSYANASTFYQEGNVTQHRNAETHTGPTTQQILDTTGLGTSSTAVDETRERVRSQMYGRCPGGPNC